MERSIISYMTSDKDARQLEFVFTMNKVLFTKMVKIKLDELDHKSVDSSLQETIE